MTQEIGRRMADIDLRQDIDRKTAYTVKVDVALTIAKGSKLATVVQEVPMRRNRPDAERLARLAVCEEFVTEFGRLPDWSRSSLFFVYSGAEYESAEIECTLVERPPPIVKIPKRPPVEAPKETTDD